MKENYYLINELIKVGYWKSSKFDFNLLKQKLDLNCYSNQSF